jgi:hypothetical protein
LKYQESNNIETRYAKNIEIMGRKLMIVKNAKSRLLNVMQGHKKPNWLPSNDELHTFSVLTTILFIYDPIGIQSALDLNFCMDNIYDEYDIEAAALMRCQQHWPDDSCLAYAIKEVLDHYFADSYPWEDCFFLAEQAMPCITNKSVLLNFVEMKKHMDKRKYKWIKIKVD